MKLTTTTQISVDGEMQAPGGPDENRRGVFERGGWAHFDHEASAWSRTVSPRPKEDTAAAMSSARICRGTGRGSRR